MQLLLPDDAAREGRDHLGEASGLVGAFLPDHVERVLFMPVAAVSGSGDQYLDLVPPVFAALGRDVVGLHDLLACRARAGVPYLGWGVETAGSPPSSSPTCCDRSTW